MLERKIKELCGCLKTLKAAWDAYENSFYAGSVARGVAENLETDCMVKLALLLPHLKSWAYPEEVHRAMVEVGLVMDEVDYVGWKCRFTTRAGEVVSVDGQTGQITRSEPKLAAVVVF